ncbi:MAG: hypothetical protein PHI98_07385 [Eubacteriales bacterium]|nr:hypothetical protein [Eubacteriales bacterium]
MLTTLNRLIGMPVVWQDQQLGYVERGVTDENARRLRGVVIRRGIGAARWVPARALKLVGQRCVLVSQQPESIPEHIDMEMRQVFLTTGERIGQVSDAVLGGMSLRLMALEISQGPLYRLLGHTSYAAAYRVIHTQRSGDEVVVPELLTWAELQRRLGKEDGG